MISRTWKSILGLAGYIIAVGRWLLTFNPCVINIIPSLRKMKLPQNKINIFVRGTLKGYGSWVLGGLYPHLTALINEKNLSFRGN